MTDGQVGQLMEFFKKNQLLDNSMLVLFSDHGDGWDAVNKTVSHGSNFDYLWCNKIVLGFYRDGFMPRKIDNLVRSIDIYPTILEMIGLESPKDIDGLSLSNLINGKQEHPRLFFAESGYSLNNKYLNGKIQNLDSDVKNFKVDYNTSLVFIKEEDYDELVLKRKSYLMIKKNLALIYNPFFGETRFGFIDPLNPEYLLKPNASLGDLNKSMLIQIKKFNKIK
jgi:phosphoglycerol transferase MdoB-like AlkP superfamily enzyme